MKKILISLIVNICLLSISFNTLAKANDSDNSTYRVSGVVSDSIGEPEPFATLRIFSINDTIHPVALGVTNENGSFSVNLQSSGNYRLSISATGKDNLENEFSLSKAAPHKDFGKMAMSESSNLLGEVEVVAQRPLVSREIDRIGYDVQGDPESRTTQLDEILRKVPMVSVDSDGSIRVKGSTDFKIYKNGRPNNSFTKNSKDIFKAIPASMIKKIEVITDPGAREDAEGVGAILNIVTLENTVVKGVMGSANLGLSTLTPVPSPNIWLTSQIDKVTFSVSGGYTKISKRQTRNSSITRQKYDETGDELYSESHSSNPGNIYWVNGEFSFELDTLNLFTAEFGGYRYSLNTETQNFTQMSSSQNQPIYSYKSRTINDPFGYLDFNGNFNYQHLTSRKGEIFTLSYAISTTNQKNKGETSYFDYENLPVNYTSQKSDYNLNFSEHTIQADWTRPFAGRHTIDLGGKFIYRDNHSVTTNDYEPGESQHYDFTHRTSIGALYADYRVSLGKLSARAGIRYEYSHLSAKYHDGSQEPFGSDLNDFVPSASLAYNATNASSFKLSYTTTINRPGISYLNPARTETPTSVSYGNPDLGSARNQNITFNYGFIHRKVNVNFGLSYIFTNDALITTKWTKDNITYSSFANQGRNRAVSPSLYINWNIGRNTSIMYNGELGYNHYANNSLGIKAHGWRRNQFIRMSQNLPWQLNLSLSVSESGPSTSLYSRSSNPSFGDGIWYNLSLRRSFLKENRLTVSLHANNIGLRTAEFRSDMFNSGINGYSITRIENRQNFTVTFNYRFGSLNASVKKTAKSISNDDLVGRKQ